MEKVKLLIQEVLTICKYDDTGVTLDLVEPALRAGIEIGMSQEELEQLAEEV